MSVMAEYVVQEINEDGKTKIEDTKQETALQTLNGSDKEEEKANQATKPLSESVSPLRRISAELRGDDAVEADMLETMLRIQEMGRTKVERDSMLVQLAIKCLGYVIEECRRETGKRFPSIQDVAEHTNQEA